MAEARIRRGGTARLTRTTGPRGRNGPGRGKPGKRRSWLGRMLHALPVSEDTLQRMLASLLSRSVASQC